MEIIATPQVRKKTRAYRTDMEICHPGNPQTASLHSSPDLVRILGVHENELNKYLGVLEAAGRIEAVSERRGKSFIVTGGPS